MKQISFDFDCTLSRKDVQDYCRSLIKKGYEAWVLTARFEDYKRYNYHQIKADCNDDLFCIADELGIPRDRIIFANMEDKWEVINSRADFNPIFHLDDDYIEVNGINRYTKTKGIDAISPMYKKKCNKILGDEEIVAH